MTKDTYETKSDRRARYNRERPKEHCDCEHTRFDHRHDVTGFVYSEWCCGCGRPSHADLLRYEHHEDELVTGLWSAAKPTPESGLSMAEISRFFHRALREGVPPETIARMYQSAREIAPRDRVAHEAMWRSLRRWTENTPWSPWLHFCPEVMEENVGRFHGVTLDARVIASMPIVDPKAERPEWGGGWVLSSYGEWNGTDGVVAMVPDEADPLGSVKERLDALRAENWDVNRVVLVCTRDVLTRVHTAMMERWRHFHAPLSAAREAFARGLDVTSRPWSGYPFLMEQRKAIHREVTAIARTLDDLAATARLLGYSEEWARNTAETLWTTTPATTAEACEEVKSMMRSGDAPPEAAANVVRGGTAAEEMVVNKIAVDEESAAVVKAFQRSLFCRNTSKSGAEPDWLRVACLYLHETETFDRSLEGTIGPDGTAIPHDKKKSMDYARERWNLLGLGGRHGHVHRASRMSPSFWKENQATNAELRAWGLMPDVGGASITKEWTDEIDFKVADKGAVADMLGISQSEASAAMEESSRLGWTPDAWCTPPGIVEAAEKAFGMSLDPAYAHAPGELDAFPVGESPAERALLKKRGWR